MNRVFVRVEKEPNGAVGDLNSFVAVVTDSYVDDIEFALLADPDLLARDPHVIVHALTEKNDAVADLIQAALGNGTDVYVNDGPEMDHGGYRSLSSGPRM